VHPNWLGTVAYFGQIDKAALAWRFDNRDNMNGLDDQLIAGVGSIELIEMMLRQLDEQLPALWKLCPEAEPSDLDA